MLWADRVHRPFASAGNLVLPGFRDGLCVSCGRGSQFVFSFFHCAEPRHAACEASIQEFGGASENDSCCPYGRVLGPKVGIRVGFGQPCLAGSAALL